MHIHSSASINGKGGSIKFTEADPSNGIILQHNTGFDLTKSINKGLFFNTLNNGNSTTAMVVDQQNNNVGIGTSKTDPSAALEISSGIGRNKGLLLPTVSLNNINDNQTVNKPPKGLMVYNDNAEMYRGEGLYMNYGTPLSPIWMGFINNQTNSFNLTNILTVSADRPINATIAANKTVSDINLNMIVEVEIDPNTENLLVLSYSMPLGLTNSSTSTFPVGYLGIRVMKSYPTNIEVEDASRKVAVVKPAGGYFMSTVSGAALDKVINTTNNKIKISYSLNGYVENISSSATSMNTIFNRWDSVGKPNFNWGNASMYIILFSKAIQ